eukprot:COSAG02_NODE_57714_length_279_cov_1.700000_1_plen_22_part_10
MYRGCIVNRGVRSHVPSNARLN